MYRSIVFFLLGMAVVFAGTTDPVQFRSDSSSANLAPKQHPKSHINIFIPSIPYSYIAKATNSGLIRSFDNARAWEYDLAKSHQRVDDYTYIFEIKRNLHFQDGSPFTIDSVIKNLNYFKKYPFLYTNIKNINFTITKVDDYKIKIVLEKKYEMFLLDLARIYFYTDTYLENYSPKGEETGSANKVPGPYGMGPYILESGYALGKKQTSELELVANPYYWDTTIPKIKRVTIFTQLNINEAFEDIVYHEGKLDIAPIAFNKKIEVLMSKFAKLVIKKSTNNFLIYFNLINGDKRLRNRETRVALNEALNQENLLSFVYKNEGEISPFSTSVRYRVVEKIAKKNEYPRNTISEKRKKELLDGLELHVFTQDRFMFLWKGIEFQLMKYGVRLQYEITTSEKDIYDQLLNTKRLKNTRNWDMLTWGDDDWYYQNPWTVFFIYESDSPWSTIPNDAVMNRYIHLFYETKIDSKAYEDIVSKILYRARMMAYTLRVPSVNKVIAVNKEVYYKPYTGGLIPLWDIQITKNHWSIRGEVPYPSSLGVPVKPQRVDHETD